MTTQPLDLDEAAELDEIDPLTKLRDEFEIPKRSDGSDQSYFAGNSLGLLPKELGWLFKKLLTNGDQKALPVISMVKKPGTN